ncbi:MAG: pur operon repressor [Clostridia bacterium]|nr:pur operon repressor [Clostridia bacterium]
MEKIKRNERLVVITKILCANPNKLFTLSYFCNMLGATKSSLSEDISVLKDYFEQRRLGRIETIPGSMGGVRFLPVSDKAAIESYIIELANNLKDSRRALSGGYIYMADILSDPEKLDKIAQCMAAPYINKEIDYVITIETKGIPIALMCARILGVPLIIARRENRINEGPQVTINYITDSGRSMSSMSLPKRALPGGKRVLVVDDFMRAGGSVKGLCDLMKEFNVIVAGISVFVATKNPERKLVDKFRSLLTLYSVDDYQGIIDIRPSGTAN